MATPRSVNLLRSETDVFSEPSYDISLANSEIVEYHPLTNISNAANPISFYIQGNDTQYVDLSESRLYLRCKIVDDKDADITITTLAPANNFLHALFKEVIVSLNETQITPHTNSYGHKAYIETLLSYGSDFKKSQAQAAMFYREKDPRKNDDKVVVARIDRTKNSQSFELLGRLHVDFFGQTRFLIPGIDIRVQLTRSGDDVCLCYFGTDAKKFKVNIEEAKFVVQKHLLLPSILMNQIKILQQGHPVCYPMRRTELKNYSIPTGTLQHVNENLLNGLLPDRIVVGICESSSFHGNLKSVPFFYGDHGLVNITITVNTDHQSTFKYDVDAAQGKIIEAFYGMFSGMGIAEADDGIDLSLSEYQTGRQLYVFDLRHVRDDFPIPKHGNVKIELKFKTGTKSVLTTLVYAEFPSVLYIDKSRNVYFKDYQKQR